MNLRLKQHLCWKKKAMSCEQNLLDFGFSNKLVLDTLRDVIVSTAGLDRQGKVSFCSESYGLCPSSLDWSSYVWVVIMQFMRRLVMVLSMLVMPAVSHKSPHGAPRHAGLRSPQHPWCRSLQAGAPGTQQDLPTLRLSHSRAHKCNHMFHSEYSVASSDMVLLWLIVDFLYIFLYVSHCFLVIKDGG